MTRCEHNCIQTGALLIPDIILDDWLGPTLAVIRCDACEQPALLYLVAWRGDGLAHRIFAIRALRRESVEVYRANINRDYCDLDRKQLETEALISTADKKASLIQVTLPSLIIEAASPLQEVPEVSDWRDIKVQSYGRWLANGNFSSD